METLRRDKIIKPLRGDKIRYKNARETPYRGYTKPIQGLYNPSSSNVKWISRASADAPTETLFQQALQNSTTKKKQRGTILGTLDREPRKQSRIGYPLYTTL